MSRGLFFFHGATPCCCMGWSLHCSFTLLRATGYKLHTMRVFNCDHCGHLVFFDSVQCLHCGSTLAFVPELLAMAALAPAPQDGPDLWRQMGQRGSADYSGRLYRLCANHTVYDACNFAVPANDFSPLCASCRQTRVLPDLSEPANLGRWKQI